jgi:uncharacterized protein YdeI (YjbR/CyaY-like superfamily)
VKPTFFSSQSDFRRWLEANHDDVAELWVGFHKKASGKPSISYPEALDEALCFGWIDGVRKSLGDTSYTIRFTPRKAKSTWSRVNIARAEDLEKLGRMAPSGSKAFAAREEARSGTYSYENRPQKFDEMYESQFRAHPRAWAFFSAQPPGYQRTAIWFVVSAKLEETRQRRLAQLIALAEKGERIGLISGTKKA